MKKVVVLTGAGVSADSGIQTFRDADGLWEGHNVMEVATPEGWASDQRLVLEFYNQRRRQLEKVHPNAAHESLVKLEEKYDVSIITQNVDDLHERAGSKKVLHLHGELKKARSSVDESLVYDCTGDISLGDKCEKGSQLRPHVVWFGEMVPMIEVAAGECMEADIFMVIGTSMVVYPAAGLINYVPGHAPKYLIDPKAHELSYMPDVTPFAQKAAEGVPDIVEKLLRDAG